MFAHDLSGSAGRNASFGGNPESVLVGLGNSCPDQLLSSKVCILEEPLDFDNNVAAGFIFDHIASTVTWHEQQCSKNGSNHICDSRQHACVDGNCNDLRVAGFPTWRINSISYEGACIIISV